MRFDGVDLQTGAAGRGGLGEGGRVLAYGHNPGMQSRLKIEYRIRRARIQCRSRIQCRDRMQCRDTMQCRDKMQCRGRTDGFIETGVDGVKVHKPT